MDAAAAPIEVRVRYTYGTYIARARGKAASCTTGERQAVQALAAKLGLTDCTITEDPDYRGVWQVRSATS